MQTQIRVSGNVELFVKDHFCPAIPPLPRTEYLSSASKEEDIEVVTRNLLQNDVHALEHESLEAYMSLVYQGTDPIKEFKDQGDYISVNKS